MNWTYNSIDDHKGYKKEYDMLQAINNEIEELENETIPELKEKAEQTKKESLQEDSKKTWEDVADIRHDIEKWEYRLNMLYEQRQEQQENLKKEADKARETNVKEAKQKKIEALQKSMEAYELLKEAYNDNEQIDRYQAKALKLTGREFNRKKAKIPVDLPNPDAQNIVWDIWLKKVTKYLKSQGLKKTS